MDPDGNGYTIGTIAAGATAIQIVKIDFDSFEQTAISIQVAKIVENCPAAFKDKLAAVPILTTSIKLGCIGDVVGISFVPATYAANISLDSIYPFFDLEGNLIYTSLHGRDALTNTWDFGKGVRVAAVCIKEARSAVENMLHIYSGAVPDMKVSSFVTFPEITKNPEDVINIDYAIRIENSNISDMLLGVDYSAEEGDSDQGEIVV
jgi:hypothetical protein